MQTLKTTPRQRQLIHILCGYDAERKADLIDQFSGGRTTTSMELTKSEAKQLINSLTESWAKFNKNNAQHRYILSLCIQLGWRKHDEKYGSVADLERLSNFLKSKRSPVDLPLQQMNSDQCSKLISCLESMIKKHY